MEEIKKEQSNEKGNSKRKLWKGRKPPHLKWSMTIVLILCWLLPLVILTISILNYASGRFSSQIASGIEKSMDTAVEICEMRIESAIRVSRNASYTPTIKDSWKNYQKDQSRVKLFEKISTFLEQMYRYDSTFLSTILYFCDEADRIYFTYGSDTDSGKYANVKSFIDVAMEDVQKKSEEIDTGIGWTNVNDHLYMVRNIMASNYKPYAVIVMDINKANMFQSFETISWFLEYDVCIDGEWVMGTDLKDMEWLTEGQDKGSAYYEGDEDAYVSFAYEFAGHDLKYIVKLDYDAIHYEKDSIRYISILMMVFILPLIFIVFYFLYRKVTRPIQQLIGAASEIEKGHFGFQVEGPESSREFQYLMNSFNSMSDTLKNQFEQIYLEELALRDANIMALQSQINPHFLNNTLEIINWEARMGENDKVCSMIEALSTMMEATMNRKKEQMIPLSEEIGYVEAYCHIIKERFDDKFQYVKQIEPAMLDVKVPRLIIQPIIENAVEHGLAGKAGTVTLKVYEDGDKLVIEVINDGTMNPEDKRKVEELLNGEDNTAALRYVSLGIRNVNKRLKIVYGQDCGLTIKNTKNECTVSTLTVKLHK